MANYDHDYIVFDEFGIREMKCMCCGQPIAGVTYDEVPSRTQPGKTEKVRVYRYHSNIRYKEILLSDGSFADMQICQDCIDQPVDMDKVARQINDARGQELVNANRSEEVVKLLLKRMKHLRVVHVTGKVSQPAKFKKGDNVKDPEVAKVILENLKVAVAEEVVAKEK